MTINTTLLRQTLAHIEAHPDAWDQATWHCETGMCFAGWAITLSGGKWDDSSDELVHVDSAVASWALQNDSWVRRHPSGEALVTAAAYAQYLLGLDPCDADDLFRGSNTLDDLREIVDSLIEQAGEGR